MHTIKWNPKFNILDRGGLIRAFLKGTGFGMAIEVKILALLEGLKVGRDMSHQCMAEGDSTKVLFWVTNVCRWCWTYDIGCKTL